MRLMQVHHLGYLQMTINKATTITSNIKYLHTSIIIHWVTPKVLFTSFHRTFITTLAKFTTIQFMEITMQHLLISIMPLKCKVEGQMAFNIIQSKDLISLLRLEPVVECRPHQTISISTLILLTLNR